MNQLDIFKTNAYHNSLPERDEKKLSEYEAKARTQDEKISRFMEEHANQSFTPCELHLLFGQQWPLTSVRRSLTNLTSDGKLEITGELRKGIFGRENNCWQWKK